MKLTKRFLSMALAVLMILSTFPVTAVAADDEGWFRPVDELFFGHTGCNTHDASDYFEGLGYVAITNDITESHKALDIGSWASHSQKIYGTNVYATRSGQVLAAGKGTGDSSDLGYYVYIKHNVNGVAYISRYLHMKEMPLVSKGDNVNQGQVIGKVGDSGAEGQPHLHFDICKCNEKYENITSWNSFSKSLRIDPTPGKVITYKVKLSAVKVTGISVSPTSASLTVGDTKTLTATISPSNATNKAVTWSSTNIGVATVSSSGVVTAKAPGTATIKVTTSDGGFVASCPVTVNAKTYTVTYDANGGSGGPTSQTKEAGVGLNISSTVPTRSGYIFKGWKAPDIVGTNGWITTEPASGTYETGYKYYTWGYECDHCRDYGYDYDVDYTFDVGDVKQDVINDVKANPSVYGTYTPSKLRYFWKIESTNKGNSYYPGQNGTTYNYFDADYIAEDGKTGTVSIYKTKYYFESMVYKQEAVTGKIYQPGDSYTSDENVTLTAIWEEDKTIYANYEFCYTPGDGLELAGWDALEYFNDQEFYMTMESTTEFDEIGIETEFGDYLQCISVENDPEEAQRRCKEYKTNRIQYFYVIKVLAIDDNTAFPKEIPFQLYARTGNTTYYSHDPDHQVESYVINNALLMDPEYVKDCVDREDRVYIRTPAYSAYDVAQNGYRAPINIAYGWAIDTATFQLIVDKPLNVCLDDGLELTIPEIAEDQEGINFSYERMSNGRVGFSFFDQNPIASDFEIWWNAGITYGELRQLLYPDSSETDNLRFDILKNGMPWDHISIDYSKVDADEIVEVVFENNAGQNLGTFEFVAAATVIDSGFCGGDTTAAYNADSGAYENLWWTLDSEGMLTIDGKGTMKDYSISWIEGEEGFEGYTTAPWQEYEEQINSVVFHNGVSSIGECAFYNIENLKGSLVLPNSVTSIGEEAFEGCKNFTGDLILPSNIENIGNGAFYCCTGITTSTLSVPGSVKYIGTQAFSHTKIEFFDVDNNNSSYKGIDGMILSKDGTELIMCPPEKSGNLIIPDGVTSIGTWAFDTCTKLTGDLTIPDSVTNIGNVAFYECSGFNGELNIGNGVKIIGDWAFTYCSNLKGNLVFPDSVKFIGEYAFRDTPFEEIYFKGSTPIVSAAIDDYASFEKDVTIYYIEGKEGWTSPTWNGYTTKIWSGLSATLDISSTAVTENKAGTVSLTLSENSGVAAMQMVLTYDAEKLILESSELGENFVGKGFEINTNIPGQVIIAWDDTEPMTMGGTLLDLTFHAKEGTEFGEVPISIPIDDDFVFVDNDYSDIAVSINPGTVEICEILIGDVNFDGKTNVIDANMVRRFSAKLLTLDDKQKLAADVNGDGSVDVIDANLIRRYAARLIDSFSVGN